MKREHQLLWKPSPLPSGYQLLNFIQSDGNQRICLGFPEVTNTPYHIEVTGTILSLTNKNSTVFWGSDNGMLSTNSSGYFNQGGNDNVYYLLNERCTIGFIVSKEGSTYRKKYYKNGNVIRSYTSTYYPHEDTYYKLNIFWVGYTGNNFAAGSYKFEHASIYDINEVLVKDYYPALRISDNTPGIFETKKGVFLTNSGSGTFIYG